ncbi:hypothetical protein [Humidisolicoccus flavus]|uniref:hypothetical protein n=1 Tax=Humidisolicoccus flavus TaxID=3111414 RepID=UPI00324510E8
MQTMTVSDTERMAMALDGEYVRHGNAWHHIDRIPNATLRAETFRAEIAPAHIVAKLSAAWVHGAAAFPRRLDLYCDRDRRADVRDRSTQRLTTTAVPADDTDDLGGVVVTSRLRTALDLLTGEEWHAELVASTRLLLEPEGDRRESVSRGVSERLTAYSAKKRQGAVRRLNEVYSLTRYTS